MADFSSAALVGLILREMKQAGIVVPPDLLRAATPGGPPTASVQAKRALLAHGRAHGGVGFLLRIGQGIHTAAPDPTLHALRRAADPFGLLDRWLRLEKYHHSHHRTEVLKQETAALHLRHVSTGAVPPTMDEDLVVLGLLAALLQMVGCNGLDVDLVDGGRHESVLRDDRIVLAALPKLPTGTWRIGWKSHAAREHEHRMIVGATLVDGLYALIDDDPLRGWTIADAARLLGHSTRSLQRRLHEAGASFSGVVRDARVKRAAQIMGEAEVSLAEAGYAAGFADQAHFTREFRRITGMAPAEWRRLAGRKVISETCEG